MTTGAAIESSESKFTAVLSAAARFPGVRIDRETYLHAALARRCSEEQVALAIAETPAAAGIALEVIEKAADDAIKFETSKTAALAAAAGIPGGFALIGTVPADMAQSLAHMLRIAQKLAYLYSWPDLFAGDGDDLDDATRGVLTLFVGVMFGANAAAEGVTKVSVMVSQQVIKQLPQKALTKGIVYPIVKTVAGHLGVKMTKDVFAKGIAKFVPVAGAVLSGGLTLATFLPMAVRLKKHLASLELSRPSAPGMGEAAAV